MDHSITPHKPTVAGDQLVAELERLGLRYLSRGPLPEPSGPLAPEALICGLAVSPEARLRAALVPLFLWRTEYATAAATAAERLSGKARVTLSCYYSAAVALQRRYAARLRELGRPVISLPDLFAATLGLPPLDDPTIRLDAIAKRHAQLSGEAINWLGTYEHAAVTFLRFAEPLPA